MPARILTSDQAQCQIAGPTLSAAVKKCTDLELEVICIADQGDRQLWRWTPHSDLPLGYIPGRIPITSKLVKHDQSDSKCMPLDDQ